MAVAGVTGAVQPSSQTASARPRGWASNGSGVLLMGSLCPMTYASGHETTDAKTNPAPAAGRLAGEEASGSLAQGAPGPQVEGKHAA